jgi:hypothetical protein
MRPNKTAGEAPPSSSAVQTQSLSGSAEHAEGQPDPNDIGDADSGGVAV